MKDVVVFAGAPWSVLSFCKVAFKYKRRAFVVCIDAEDGVYKTSKYVTGILNVNRNNVEQSFILFLKKNIFEEKPILFVASDKSCELVVEHRSFFEDRFEISMPSDDIIHSFINKALADVEAKKHGLVTPKTISIHAIENQQYVLNHFYFPVVIKPFSANIDESIGFKYKICDREKFTKLAETLLNSNKKFLCQEYIEGGDSASKFYIFYRNAHGQIIDCMGEKTLQTKGIMTIGTVKYDENISIISRVFLESINYVGIGGIEYKKNKGKYYFIEMSTRAEGFLPISDMAGCSIAEYAYLDLNGMSLNYEKRMKEGVIYVVFFSWLLNRILSYKLLILLKEIFLFCFNDKLYFVEKWSNVFKYYLNFFFKKICCKIFKK